MKGLLAALAGIFGIAWWRRRAKPAAPDRAEELRTKLAQARQAEAESDVGEAADARPPEETGADQVPDDVDARRRDVHERTRRQIDELRGE